MDHVISGYRGFSALLSAAIDRLLIPLAVVVGLTGGAMIGAELARMQSAPVETIH
jgi:hypothetical protein